jgi:hypothetical protein
MGAFFPLSFSAVLAAVVLAASNPLPPFPAISSSAPVGFRTRTGGKPCTADQIRRGGRQIRADRGANRADPALETAEGSKFGWDWRGNPYLFRFSSRDATESEIFFLDCGERLLVWWGFYKGRELTV